MKGIRGESIEVLQGCEGEGCGFRRCSMDEFESVGGKVFMEETG